MKKLSIISHFYNHPLKVENQIKFWESLPDIFLNQVEFILIDDCSEDKPTIKTSKIDLKYYEIVTDIPWNQSGARNLGTVQAQGEWALFFDIDQIFIYEHIFNLLRSIDNLNTSVMYYFKIKELIDITCNKSLTHHPNTFLANLSSFKNMAMYDEDFSGYYGYEDLYMPKVWESNGGTRALFNDFIYFENIEFGTTNLDRDLSRNRELANVKMLEGCNKPEKLIRFKWKKII